MGESEGKAWRVQKLAGTILQNCSSCHFSDLRCIDNRDSDAGETSERWSRRKQWLRRKKNTGEDEAMLEVPEVPLEKDAVPGVERAVWRIL